MDGRYAPSPSGDLHLGNLRTALAAWLQARAAGSRFLLRVDDLDPGRSRAGFVTSQLEDLAALGLTHDGEIVHQSTRAARYDEALQVLREEGLVYECFCTRAEIRQAVSAPHGPGPEGAYPGTCRTLTAARRAQLVADGRRPALRVRADGARQIVRDTLAGEVTVTVDDAVVRRSDGAHAYNLATVVDDADAGVQEVVRGADLLDTTPRQVWLAAQLGLTAPAAYVHVPLVLGPDGERMAKRHGAVTLRQILAVDGWTPARVLGLLAASLLPGHGPGPATADALVDEWDLRRVPPGPVVLTPPVAGSADLGG